MKGLVLSLGALLLAAAMLAGCASARRFRPMAASEGTGELARGREVFMQHCHSCHPGGEGGLGPAINNKPLPKALIAFQVRQGLGVMPEFPPEALSEADLQALLEYLEQLRAAAPPPGAEG